MNILKEMQRIVSQTYMYLLVDLINASSLRYFFKVVSVIVQPEKQEAKLLG